MNSGADNLNESSDFSVTDANTLVENHDGSRNAPIGVNEQLDHAWRTCEAFGTVPKTHWQQQRWSVRAKYAWGVELYEALEKCRAHYT